VVAKGPPGSHLQVVIPIGERNQRREKGPRTNEDEDEQPSSFTTCAPRHLRGGTRSGWLGCHSGLPSVAVLPPSMDVRRPAPTADPEDPYRLACRKPDV
jgi:hypothetical protein